jgi:Cof subfamily protein (haloacid dehalogenase superfamily)
MSIKLVAIDIDGTLLNENNHLTEGTIDAIQKAHEQGVQIVLCTGRPLTGAKPYLQKLGLDNSTDNHVITFNGSLVQSTNGDIMVRHTLTFADYVDIEALTRKIGVHFHCETDQYIYTANKDLSPYTIGEAYLVRMPIRYREVSEMTSGLSISKGMIIDDPRLITQIQEEHLVPDDFYDRFYIVQSEPFFLEIMNKSASKGNALAELCQELGLERSEVMAIGDQGNDLTMIDFAGTGVAMGNAIDEVKQHANEITLPNSQDGVAAAIKKWVLN